MYSNSLTVSELPADVLSNVINTMSIAMIGVDRNTGQLVLINDKFCTDVRIKREYLLGKKYTAVLWEQFVHLLDKLIANANKRASQTEIYYWAKRGMWGQINAHNIDFGDNRQTLIISITNITELGKSEYEYKRMVYYDNLLNLPNGRQLEQDIAGVASFDDIALIHFDIKRFSTVNDLYGWDTGDYVLEQIRDWLLATNLPTCRLYRVNDDEFCLLIQNITLRDALARADEVVERFTEPWKQLEGKLTMPLYCTIVMGVVYGEPLKGDIRNLLYRTLSNSNSNDKYTLYDAKMDQEARERLFLRQSLINTVQQDMLGFAVYLQPIVEAKTRRWAGAEALCRWKMPNSDEMVSPLVFISEAEEIGLIEQIDTWVLKTAMSNSIKWGLAGKRYFLDVNVSPKQNVTEIYIKQLMNLIANCNFPTNQLNLEITESNKFDFSNDNLKRWEHLRDAGITISLDDFGTGYSSFNNLMRLPASVLKIEKAFVDNLEHDSYLQYLLQLMVNLAHRLDMQIITEGVETEGQALLLEEYGVDFMQGYLFSKPLSPEDFEANLHKYQ